MSWLHNKRPIVIDADLAEHIGLNEAITLQQLHYWAGSTSSGVDHDGRRWIYNSHQEWKKQFPFWKIDTIKRNFASLKEKGLILVEQLAKSKHDRTNYYAIDYAALDKKEAESRVLDDECKLHSSTSADCTDRVAEDALIDKGNVPPSIGAKSAVLTETTTETTPEITADTFPAGAAAPTGGKRKPAAKKDKPAAPAVVKGPMVIESGDKRIEIPGELKYPGADTKSHKTWINYAVCYNKRYGAWPVWNRTVAGMVSNLIERVGADAAPKVAAFYLGVNDARIVSAGHGFKLLLVDAEKYHTQWQTGRQMTATRARQIDQTASNHDAAEEAMQLLASRRAEYANA